MAREAAGSGRGGPLPAAPTTALRRCHAAPGGPAERSPAPGARMRSASGIRELGEPGRRGGARRPCDGPTARRSTAARKRHRRSGSGVCAAGSPGCFTWRFARGGWGRRRGSHASQPAPGSHRPGPPPGQRPDSGTGIATRAGERARTRRACLSSHNLPARGSFHRWRGRRCSGSSSPCAGPKGRHLGVPAVRLVGFDPPAPGPLEGAGGSSPSREVSAAGPASGPASR